MPEGKLIYVLSGRSNIHLAREVDDVAGPLSLCGTGLEVWHKIETPDAGDRWCRRCLRALKAEVVAQQAESESSGFDDPEIAAMERILNALAPLSRAKQGRILRWAIDRYVKKPEV